ncbi:hypothetical protein [Piscinibacter terrae]|uniref:hypothetical protein n=1 Tax=Piscinibacter terrae TaxID=2496871 RepID=UPI000F5A7076|nr:hypothetical protein [Albitalea terrae]
MEIQQRLSGLQAEAAAAPSCRGHGGELGETALVTMKLDAGAIATPFDDEPGLPSQADVQALNDARFVEPDMPRVNAKPPARGRWWRQIFTFDQAVNVFSVMVSVFLGVVWV